MQLEVLQLEIAKLEVKPGELLAIRFPEGTPVEDIESCTTGLREVLPDGVKGIFFVGNIELFVVSAEEARVIDGQAVDNT